MNKIQEATNKPLTVGQAASIVTGSGVGAGVLAMPVLANRVGYPLTLVILLIGFVSVYFLHMMVAQLCIKCGGQSQIVEVLSRFVLKPKIRKVGRFIFFLIMAVMLYATLTAYITGTSQTLSDALGIPEYASKIVFYVVAAAVALFGLKLLGVVEKYAIIVMLIVVGALAVGSCFSIKNPINMIPSGAKDCIAFVGSACFALNAFFNIPQVVTGLRNDEKKIRKATFLGMLFNIIIVLIIITFSILCSENGIITDPCIAGWAKGIGPWANVMGVTFTLLAMLTSYWAASFTLRDILCETFGMRPTIGWLFATLPTLALSFVPLTNFKFFLTISGTMVALLLALFAIPSFYIVRKQDKGKSILEFFGALPFQLFTLATYICMATGNIWSLF